MEDLNKNNILAKWAANKLTKEEKESLEKNTNLNDLNTVLKNIDHWTLPKINASEKFNDFDLAQKKVNTRKTIQLKTVFSIAASIILLIGIYLVYQEYNSNVKLITHIGESIKHTLPCNSTFTLDAKSSAKYDKQDWEKERIILLEGQAFFDIKKGAPFIVKTQQGDVKVLGTKFNVAVDNNKLKVCCYRGKVKVESDKVSKILQPQQGVIIEKDSAIDIIINEELPDWIKGYTIYSNSRLEDVINDLHKYYQVDIDLPDQYKKLEYSGSIMHNDLEVSLELIFSPMGISYSLLNDYKVIIK